MFMIDLSGTSYYSVLGISPDAGKKEVIAARSKKQTEIKNMQVVATDDAEKLQLEEELLKVNDAGDALARPDRRKKYDMENAHLRFYIERPAAAPFFSNKVDRIAVLTRILREHLTTLGENISPLNDFDRMDFSADETSNELLDSLLK
jgi:curved DNA-binding protein CbpA